MSIAASEVICRVFQNVQYIVSAESTLTMWLRSIRAEHWLIRVCIIMMMIKYNTEVLSVELSLIIS